MSSSTSRSLSCTPEPATFCENAGLGQAVRWRLNSRENVCARSPARR